MTAHQPSHRGDGSAARDPPEILIVGTLGGGGIHRYVEEQHRRLDGAFSVALYDVTTPSTGEGARWFLQGLFRAVRAALRFPFRSPPDIVHVHTSHRFSFYRMAFYVLFAAHIWRCPAVLHIHGSSFDEFVGTDSRPVRAIQSLVFGAADRVVVLSDYWRDVLEPHVDGTPITVLPNAVDPDQFTPSFDVEPPHVVFVSNLIERKGVRELCAAIEALADRDVPFQASIAGDGPLAGIVEAVADRHEHVDYLGYVSETRKRELLGEGSVFVLPTYAEGLPIAMLEGMAGGNAVLSTSVGSIPEVVGEENGVLVEPGDETQLTEALASLVTAPADVEAMARRNRRLVEEEYSWNRTVDRLARLYDALLGGEHGDPHLATAKRDAAPERP